VEELQELDKMGALVPDQSSVVQHFDPDEFANASTIAAWLESQADSEKE
jgi:hypothetical protein